MKNNYLYNPKIIGSLYLFVIPLFSLIYWLNPCFWNSPLTIIQSIYFSTITITTLGYGDIVPKTEMARILTASEALLGIGLIGFFLNAVAHTKIETEQSHLHDILKEHLRSQYIQFRENVSYIFLWAETSGHEVDQTNAKKLVDMLQFRNYFGANNKEKWYAALNGLENNTDIQTDLYVEIDLLVQQITYVTNNLSIDDKEALKRLTRFSQHIYRMKNLTIDKSDSVRYLSQFTWEIMTGWSTTEGYNDEDYFLDAIDRL